LRKDFVKGAAQAFVRASSSTIARYQAAVGGQMAEVKNKAGSQSWGIGEAVENTVG